MMVVDQDVVVVGMSFVDERRGGCGDIEWCTVKDTGILDMNIRGRTPEHC